MKTNRYLQVSMMNHPIFIGIDEVGRGPLLGRVYAAAVILPKDMDTSKIKDSKLIHSAKKRTAIAEMIRTNAVAWSIHYESEQAIDNINILQATQNAMHKCIFDLLNQLKEKNGVEENIVLLVDGNYFRPYVYYDSQIKAWKELQYKCIVKGDNSEACIGAASIIAKVARDAYIDDLCSQYPDLHDKYDLMSNKGYGSKKHLDGIKKYGISQWHRKTFGICKRYAEVSEPRDDECMQDECMQTI